jgi:thiamine kinase-like enzyme
MTTLLKIEPAVAEELAKLTAAERAFIENATAESMRNVVHEDVIRQMIVEAIELAKKARVAAQKEKVEVEEEAEGSSTEDDDDDEEIEDGLWEKVRKVLAIKY